MDDEKYISNDELKALIPDSLRMHFAIEGTMLPIEFRPCLQSVSIALRCIEGKLDFHVIPTISIVLNNGDDFVFTRGVGTISVKLSPSTAHAHFKNLCLINLAHLQTINVPFQVSCILEEIVHASMNVKSETLVGHVVCMLYEPALRCGYAELKLRLESL